MAAPKLVNWEAGKLGNFPVVVLPVLGKGGKSCSFPIPHFLGRDGCADECIPNAADVKKVLHVLLSQVGLDVLAERAEELRQSAVRRQKLLNVAL